MKKDYLELSKPRMVLVFITVGAASFFIEGGRSLQHLIALIIVGLLAPSATNIITSAIDRDIDALMQRTRSRPVSSGRINTKKAFSLGTLLRLFSLVVSFIFLGALVAFLVLGAILGVAILYNLLLKRRTPFSTLIGAVPGSAPVLVGGAAARGEMTMDIVFLAGILFLWQLPHFWIFSLRHQKDYSRAAIPSMASVYGERTARRLVLVFSIVLVVYTLALSNNFGALYLGSSVLAGAFVLRASIEIWKGKRPVSGHVNSYIFFILIVFISAAVS